MKETYALILAVYRMGSEGCAISKGFEYNKEIETWISSSDTNRLNHIAYAVRKERMARVERSRMCPSGKKKQRARDPFRLFWSAVCIPHRPFHVQHPMGSALEWNTS